MLSRPYGNWSRKETEGAFLSKAPRRLKDPCFLKGSHVYPLVNLIIIVLRPSFEQFPYERISEKNGRNLLVPRLWSGMGMGEISGIGC